MKYPRALFYLALVMLATTPMASPQSALTVVAAQHATYVYWGPAVNAYPLILDRQTGNGAFEKIATISPQTDQAKVAAVMSSSPDPFSLHMRLNSDFAKKAEQDRAADERLSLVSVGYAQVRGYGYLDRNVEPGVTYHYRLSTSSGGRERLIGEVEVTARKSAIAPPTDLKARNTKDDLPLIEWSGQPLTSFQLSRADKREGPFTNLTLLPMVAIRGQSKLQFLDHSAVRDGRTYYYRVQPLDLLGEPGVESEIVSLTTLNRTPPRSPSGLRATVAPAAVQLSWQRNPETDLAGYRLYRTQLEKDKDLQKKLIESRGELLTKKNLAPDTTQYEDSKAEPGEVYSYRISAFDKAGNESLLSPPVLASPKSRIPPEPPTGLAGQALPDGRVLLTWNPSREKQVSAYHIYRGVGQQGNMVFSTEVVAPTGAEKPRFEDHLNVRSQADYRYAVSAVDSTDNESQLSNAISIKLSEVIPFKPIQRAPAVPVITALTSGDRFIEVSWSAVTDKDVAGFNVYRSQKPGPPVRLNNKLLSVDVFQFRDSNVVPGARYEYSVSAVDRGGKESGRSESKSSVTFAKVETPPPSGLHFQTTKSNRYLSWQKAPNVARFIVYFSQDPQGPPRQIAVVTENTFLLPREAPAGWYTVQAVSEEGTVSPKSAPVKLK